MRVNKKQITVMSLLNVVIIALAAVILFRPAYSADSEPQGDPVGGEPHVHQKLRAAEDGKADGILGETRLMGLGEESVVGAYEMGGALFVFGNATVAGLDFDGYGGFLCKLGDTGGILGFTYFSGRMTAAGIVEGGFFVGTTAEEDGKEVSRLYFVTESGEKTELSRTDGYVEDIFWVNGKGAAVVTRPYGAVKLTEYGNEEGAWSAGKSTRITSGLDIEYFDSYYVGNGYVVAARAYDGTYYDSLVFYTFEAGGSAAAHYFGGREESRLTPYAVMPYAEGYLAVCRRAGVATIATVDFTFTSYRRDTLSFSFDNASLFYADKKYYACFDCPDGYVTYEIYGALNRRTLSALDGKKVQAVSGVSVFAATEGDEMSLTDIASGQVVQFDITNCTVYRALNFGGGICVVLSATGGSAVGAPTGPSDVYILRIKNF